MDFIHFAAAYTPGKCRGYCGYGMKMMVYGSCLSDASKWLTGDKITGFAQRCYWLAEQKKGLGINGVWFAHDSLHLW